MRGGVVMSSVLAETMDLVIEKSRGRLGAFVEDVVMGIFFTGVKISTGHAGVAFTPIGELPEIGMLPYQCSTDAGSRQLRKNTRLGNSLLRLDRNVLKSAIGVATLNAVSQFILDSEDPGGFRIVEGY